MRVPFPDISAREPSGFQIAMSSQSLPRASTSRIPSGADERAYAPASSGSSATR